jgi:hypothetical protein
MRRLTVVLLVAAAVAGCSKKAEPPPAPPAAAPAAQPEAAQSGSTVKGTLVERLDAPPYSYLHIQAGKEELWAAVPQATVEKGAAVTVVNAVPMNGFESKQLKRKFDVVFFGNLEGAGGAAPGGMPPGMPAGMAQAPAGMPAPGEPPNPEMMKQAHAQAAAGPNDVGDVKVDKASGADARTVAEIHSQRTALKEKTVTVRGKVVKYNAAIMGKNWLHLRDGTGKADKGDHDITVTTGDQAAVGDVVTVKGVVRTDKDFGAGYAYPVIVEDAKVTKK